MSIVELAGNLSEMEDYEALPEGVYRAEITEIEIRRTEKVPGGFIYMNLKVHPDQYPPDYDPENAPEGVVVNYSRVAIPDGTNRRQVKPFRGLIKALGMKEKSDKFDFDKAIGSEVQVLLKKGEYQGAAVNNVDSLTAVPKV